MKRLRATSTTIAMRRSRRSDARSTWWRYVDVERSDSVVRETQGRWSGVGACELLEEGLQDPGGDTGVGKGAVGQWLGDAERTSARGERIALLAGQGGSGQLEGAQTQSLMRLGTGASELMGDERGIEGEVVGDDHCALEVALQCGERIGEGGSADEIGGGDAMDPSGPRIAARIDEGGPFGDGLTIGRAPDHSDLDDAIVTGTKPGGLDVNDGEGKRFERGSRPVELHRHQTAESVGGGGPLPTSAAESGIGARLGLDRSGIVHVLTLRTPL